MRITKEIARNVANQLTSKKRKELYELQERFKDELLKTYLEDIPKEIKELAQKYPYYFKKSNSISFGGCNGFSYEYFSLSESVIIKQSSSYYTEISSENAKKLNKIHNKIQDKKNEITELFKDLEIALYSLKTYSKVSEQFPEAIPFLPKSITTELSVNISNIRKRI